MPRHSRRRSTRNVNAGVIGQHVSDIMAIPALNAQYVPDFIEYRVHTVAVTALLQAIESIPPVYLYGHRIRIVVDPVE